MHSAQDESLCKVEILNIYIFNVSIEASLKAAVLAASVLNTESSCAFASGSVKSVCAQYCTVSFVN